MADFSRSLDPASQLPQAQASWAAGKFRAGNSDEFRLGVDAVRDIGAARFRVVMPRALQPRRPRHQRWSLLMMTLPTDLFPKHAVGTVAGLVGLGGAMGGVVIG